MSNLEEHKKYQDIVSKQAAELQNEKNKNLIKDLVTKKIRTGFIFSIAEIERIFGHLWGEQKDENSDFTETEEFYYKLKEEFRKCVLDNGNKQIRNAIKELDIYL